MENFTALGANEITKNITFQGEMHKKFFLLYLPECRNEDVYHQAYGTDKTGNQQGTSRCYQLCGGVPCRPLRLSPTLPTTSKR